MLGEQTSAGQADDSHAPLIDALEKSDSSRAIARCTG